MYGQTKNHLAHTKSSAYKSAATKIAKSSSRNRSLLYVVNNIATSSILHPILNPSFSYHSPTIEPTAPTETPFPPKTRHKAHRAQQLKATGSNFLSQASPFLPTIHKAKTIKHDAKTLSKENLSELISTPDKTPRRIQSVLPQPKHKPNLHFAIRAKGTN